MTASRRLEVNEVNDVTVVHFQERKIIEDIGIHELSQELYRLVDVENRKKLVLNFSSVQFLSSTALGTLIKLYKKLRTRGGSMVLCAIKPEILQVFEICNLDRIFTIKEDEADALATFV